MSKNQRHNDKLPSVTIVSTGKNLLPQDYKNLTIVGKQTDKPLELFNTYIDKGFDTQIVGFISGDYNFTQKNAVTLMVQKLNNAAIIGGVYADLITDNSKQTANQYYPAFHADILNGSILMLSPLFLKTNLLVKQRFNIHLQKLYNWLFFLTISKNILSAHIPLPLYIRYHNTDINQQLEKEFKYIKQWLQYDI